MPPKKPKKVKFTNPPAKTKLGATVALDFEGEYAAAVTGRETGVHAQIFRKIDGFPFFEHIPKKFTHNQAKFSDSISWKPTRLGTHSIRLILWDRTNPPENGKDHASHVIHIRVTKD